MATDNDYAAGQYFWKVQYTLRNEDFCAKADVVCRLGGELSERYGLDRCSCFELLDGPHKRGFLESDYRKRFLDILDEYYVSPCLQSLDVLEYIEGGGECVQYEIPQFYYSSFVWNDKFELGVHEGRKNLTLTIDIESPESVIKNDVVSLVRVAKEAIKRNESLSDSLNENWSEFKQASPVDKVARTESQYKRNGDPSRAVGLWMWDFVHNPKSPKRYGDIAEAGRVVATRCEGSSHAELRKFGYKEPDYYKDLYFRTKACIDQHSVLSLKK